MGASGDPGGHAGSDGEARRAGSRRQDPPGRSETRVARPAPRGPGPLEATAEREAVRWLGLVDQGLYGQSWSSAGGIFRRSFSEEEWSLAVESARDARSRLGQRKLRAIERETALPGAPPGAYVLVHFETARGRESPVREVVTMVEAADGRLVVAAYFFIS